MAGLHPRQAGKPSTYPESVPYGWLVAVREPPSRRFVVADNFDCYQRRRALLTDSITALGSRQNRFAG